MGRRAVATWGQVGGAGAVGSEGDDDMTDPVSGATSSGSTSTGTIVGGPGGDQTPQHTFTPFTYNGKVFNTEAELTAHLNGLNTEIGTLKARPTFTPTPTTTAIPSGGMATPLGGTVVPSNDELITQILSDPKKFREDIKAELRTEYFSREQARTNISNMWTQFWDENKELKPYENIVKMVFDGNQSVLGPLQMQEVPAKLAELARNTVLTINKDAFQRGQRRTTQEGRAVVEGAGTPSARRQQEEENPQQEQAPKSLSEAIRARQRARRAQPSSRQAAAS